MIQIKNKFIIFWAITDVRTDSRSYPDTADNEKRRNWKHHWVQTDAHSV